MVLASDLPEVTVLANSWVRIWTQIFLTPKIHSFSWKIWQLFYFMFLTPCLFPPLFHSHPIDSLVNMYYAPIGALCWVKSFMYPSPSERYTFLQIYGHLFVYICPFHQTPPWLEWGSALHHLCCRGRREVPRPACLNPSHPHASGFQKTLAQLLCLVAHCRRSCRFPSSGEWFDSFLWPSINKQRCTNQARQFTEDPSPNVGNQRCYF